VTLDVAYHAAMQRIDDVVAEVRHNARYQHAHHLGEILLDWRVEAVQGLASRLPTDPTLLRRRAELLAREAVLLIAEIDARDDLDVTTGEPG
jgi:hypothetical protein